MGIVNSNVKYEYVNKTVILIITSLHYYFFKCSITIIISQTEKTMKHFGFKVDKQKIIQPKMTLGGSQECIRKNVM